MAGEGGSAATGSCASRHGTSSSTLGRLRCGIDLVRVADVAECVARYGERYLRRVYTEREMRDCFGPAAGVVLQRLAARFAAKEAAFKVLEVDREPPAWTDVEVRRLPSGACALELRGRARALADEQGLGELAVSLTHEGDVALAVSVACVAGQEPGESRDWSVRRWQ